MYYFIVNPASGSNRGRSVWKSVKKKLDQAGAAYRSFLLSGQGEARALAASLAASGQPAVIVVGGGDGTINEVINGLYSGGLDLGHITFGCIPTGSGNDFVRGLGLSRTPGDALSSILHPREIRRINIGKTVCSSRISYSFAVSSGTGFDAAVCNSVLHSKLKTMLNLFHSGKLIYMTTALWQIFTMKRRALTVTIDGNETSMYEKAYFAAAMNLPYEGGGFCFCPDARPDDGYLDLIIVNRISRLRALTILPLAFVGKHIGKPGIHILRCEKARITVSDPLCVHTDGEIPGFYQETEFSLHENKLAVILR